MSTYKTQEAHAYERYLFHWLRFYCWRSSGLSKPDPMNRNMMLSLQPQAEQHVRRLKREEQDK